MARNQGAPPSALRSRVKPRTEAGPIKVPAPAPKTAAPDAPRKKTTLVQFGREVRAEARKITWTTRKETWITSVMVFIMVVMTAIFFLVVDWGLGQSIQALLKLVA